MNFELAVVGQDIACEIPPIPINLPNCRSLKFTSYLGKGANEVQRSVLYKLQSLEEVTPLYSLSLIISGTICKFPLY